MATETKHTPGPIRVEHGLNLMASDGLSLTGTCGSPDLVARSKANAAHAALCWNSHDATVAALELADTTIEWMADVVQSEFDEDADVEKAHDVIRAALTAAKEAGQ